MGQGYSGAGGAATTGGGSAGGTAGATGGAVVPEGGFSKMTEAQLEAFINQQAIATARGEEAMEYLPQNMKDAAATQRAQSLARQLAVVENLPDETEKNAAKLVWLIARWWRPTRLATHCLETDACLRRIINVDTLL